MPFDVDIRHVNAAEKKLGVKFPASFVVKMTRDNGGWVEAGGGAWNLYPFLDMAERTRIKRTCNDIVYETNESRKWPGFPPSAVAIGTDGSADRLIMMPRDDAPNVLGPIFIFDSETSELEEIADDFADLIE